METMPEPQNSSQEDEDPLAPLSSDIIDRVVEINSDSEPRKSVRQRLGSMAARRSVRGYDTESNERPHLVEQAVVAESRFLMRKSVEGPRTRTA